MCGPGERRHAQKGRWPNGLQGDQESTCRSDKARGDPGHNPDPTCAGLSAARWAGTFASLYRRFRTPLQLTGKPHASVEVGMAGIPLGPSICTLANALVSGLSGAGCDGDRQVSPGLTIEVSPPSWNPAGYGCRYVSPHTGGGARDLPQVDVGFLFRQARCGRKARSDPPGRSVPGSRVGFREPAGPDAGVSWLRFELRKPTDCTRR